MMNASQGNSPINLDGRNLYIGIVQARFNAEVSQQLLNACLTELQALGVLKKHIHHIQVPGALEIPVALQALASQSKFDALIALGCVIRGETYHFELVANESARGISQVALDFEIPVANAVLTVENQAQAEARQIDKGSDAARVAVEMAQLMDELR